MAREARFPHARRRRRPHGRFAAIGLAGAFAILLIWPATAPAGHVLDLTSAGGTGTAAMGLEPTPVRSPAPSAIAAVPSDAVPATSPAARFPAPGGVLPKGNPAATQLTQPTPSASVGVTTPDGATRELNFGESLVTTAPPLEGLTGYVWPLAHPRLTLPFGPTVWGTRVVNGERYHDGVDLATFCGDRIMATHTGTVLAASRRYDAFMGWLGDLRPYLRRLDQRGSWPTLPIIVVIDDGNGYRSVYAHFGSVVVKPGQAVKAGQLIGYEGRTGRASGCHLHYDLFSPLELAPMAIRPDVVKRMLLPTAEIARVDPLLVLPPKAGINAPKKTPQPSATPEESAGP